METSSEHDKRIANLTLGNVYPLYLAKVTKKNRTQEELNKVINWLTGYNEEKLQSLIDENITFDQFFRLATVNPNANLITGVICGYRVENIENELTRNIRYLDKLVDELAKGRKIEKILRSKT